MTTKRLFTILLLSLMGLIQPCYSAPSGKINRTASRASKEVIERLDANLAKIFRFEVYDQSHGTDDWFELESRGNKIIVRSGNSVSGCVGANWYLRHYLGGSITSCGSQVVIPDDLPEVSLEMSTPLAINFYMNYCTFSYTTAFWQWADWQREIDLMAINGINTPMAVVGAEVIWRNTLREFGYSDSEIKEFLCGPAYFGWLLMDNLEGIGGPLPDEWFDKQTQMQQQIVARMRELGMEPMFQSFFGMVPTSLKTKFPNENYINQGTWNSLARPDMLDPQSELFAEMAEVWYGQYEQLFGVAKYWGGDLFHEGGHTGGLDVAQTALLVQQHLLKAKSDAVWILQSWGGNPRTDLLSSLDKEHVMVVDICAEFWSHWKSRGAFEGTPWLWSHLTNYGGNIGLHGRLDAIVEGVVDAQNDAVASPFLRGTGSTPEGIEVNPVTFELANEMRWHSRTIDIDQWLWGYAARRYGDSFASVDSAWTIFHQTAYGTFDEHRRPSESVFCALPSLKGESITASAWSQCKIFYDPELHAKGVELLLEDSESLQESEGYHFDVVDMVRQYLTNRGRTAYYAIVDAYNAGDLKTLRSQSELFLNLMQDQDRLLSTHPHFFVGTYLDEARSKAHDDEFADLCELNLRQLIGTWTENSSQVRDYAHREWGGVIGDYYYPRWRDYLAYLVADLSGEKVTAPDSFEQERKWIESNNKYTLSPSDPVALAKEIFGKYRCR
ncbi:MAG: alpha-N-acetylglucosaminidase [Rikenellaceae bacterium]